MDIVKEVAHNGLNFVAVDGRLDGVLDGLILFQIFRFVCELLNTEYEQKS